MEINSCSPIPLFRPGSVHSGSASWDDFGQVFPDEFHKSWLSSVIGSQTMSKELRVMVNMTYSVQGRVPHYAYGIQGLGLTRRMVCKNMILPLEKIWVTLHTHDVLHVRFPLWWYECAHTHDVWQSKIQICCLITLFINGNSNFCSSHVMMIN